MSMSLVKILTERNFLSHGNPQHSADIYFCMVFSAYRPGSIAAVLESITLDSTKIFEMIAI